MNCDTVQDRIRDLARQAVTDDEATACMEHIESCPDCRAALRGAEALVRIRGRKTDDAGGGLFDRVIAAATSDQRGRKSSQRFLVGTLFGVALAASIFGIAMYLGWSSVVLDETPPQAEFVVAVGEARRMSLAFETDQALPGAMISIVLSGDIEIEGYGHRRELNWPEDLEAGVNRLSLPVMASGPAGGYMVVRLEHPRSEQVLVVNLPTRNRDQEDDFAWD